MTDDESTDWFLPYNSFLDDALAEGQEDSAVQILVHWQVVGYNRISHRSAPEALEERKFTEKSE